MKASAAAAGPSVATSWVRGTARHFESVGLDVRALFRDAGLNYEDLNDRDARIDGDSISLLWELAVARSGDPNLGLANSDVLHPGSLDMIMHVMMSSPDLGAAVSRFIRYMRLVSHVADISLVRNDAGYVFTLHIDGLTRPVPRARVDFALVMILNIMRWLTALNLRPLAAGFPYAAAGELEAYRQAFRCPLQFNAPSHQLHFAASDVLAPLPTANPALQELTDRVASDHLTLLDSTRVVPRVKHIVVQRLPDGEPLRARIAEVLGMSERTLQRRLDAEGTSFNELVDQTRRELAKQYLRSRKIAIAEVGYLLGFSDQSTFYRACKRWFGTSPGDYRSSVANAP